MSVSPSDFRAAFTEFANDTTYPDAMITYWSSLAEITLNIDRWGDFLTHGKYLFIAHNCALSAAASANAAVGSIPGQSGVVAGKSVSDVSVSFDTNASNIQGAGSYNETRYGRQLMGLARIVGIVAFVGTPQTT